MFPGNLCFHAYMHSRAKNRHPTFYPFSNFLPSDILPFFSQAISSRVIRGSSTINRQKHCKLCPVKVSIIMEPVVASDCHPPLLHQLRVLHGALNSNTDKPMMAFFPIKSTLLAISLIEWHRWLQMWRTSLTAPHS